MSDNVILISREQAEEWSGHKLTDFDMERLSQYIPHSSIPDAINTIVGTMFEDEEGEEV